MNELRRDYLTGEWVAISTERAKRPVDFGSSRLECPFCPHNEHMTPPTIYRNGHVRVFANKYPALTDEDLNSYGIHEVLVDTAVHEQQLHELPARDICEVLFALQSRSKALSANEQIKHVQIFKNQGLSAGATLSHSHWQILALPMVPPKQMQIRNSFEEYFVENGECYLCEFFEKQYHGQTVYENAGAIAYIPYASPYADSVYLAPRRHSQILTELSPDDCLHIADILKRVLYALYDLHPGCGYNICFQSGSGGQAAANHLYMQVIPRLGNLAGFELSTGCFINSTDPLVSIRKFKRIISRT